MAELIIKKAEEPDYDKVRDFYHSMTDQMKERGYMGCMGDTIASAMVLNHRGSREYRDIEWTEDLNYSIQR